MGLKAAIGVVEISNNLKEIINLKTKNFSKLKR